MTEQALKIDLADNAKAARWARELDVTREQLAEAIDAVGNLAADVELHLKGSRASTNADVANQTAVGGDLP